MATTVRPPVQRVQPRNRCILRCTASASPAPSRRDARLASRRDALLASGAVLASPLLGVSPASGATSAFDFEVMQYDKPLSMSTFANQVLVVVNIASE